jgi:hypothetical protein
MSIPERTNSPISALVQISQLGIARSPVQSRLTILPGVHVPLLLPLADGEAVVLPLPAFVFDVGAVEFLAHDLSGEGIFRECIDCGAERLRQSMNAFLGQFILGVFIGIDLAGLTCFQFVPNSG